VSGVPGIAAAVRASDGGGHAIRLLAAPAAT
jgi:hypothetical protein